MTKFEETTQELTKAKVKLEVAKQRLKKAQRAYDWEFANVRYLEYIIEGMLDEAHKFGRTTET